MRKYEVFIRKMVLFLVLLCVSAGISATTCRSSAVKHHFDVLNGYPQGRKGYVVDHLCPLEQGGLDIVTNMQYQTLVEGKAKDKIENTPRGRLMYCTPSNSLSYRTVFNCK